MYFMSLPRSLKDTLTHTNAQLLKINVMSISWLHEFASFFKRHAHMHTHIMRSDLKCTLYTLININVMYFMSLPRSLKDTLIHI